MTIGQIPGLPDVRGNPSVSGIGPISMTNDTDAFFLDGPFQINQVDLSYLVRQTGGNSVDGHITMTLGVYGSGIVDADRPDGASFGFNGNDPVVIRFTPEPTTAILAMFALAAVACMRWRKRGT